MESRRKIPKSLDVRGKSSYAGNERLNEEKTYIAETLEAQQDYTPGYELVTRGIFYGARMLSAQYGTEFVSPYYDDVKKDVTREEVLKYY